MAHLKAAALAALLVGLTAGGASAQNALAGSWELTVQAPQGTNIVTMNVAIDGAKATGTLTSTLGSVPVTGTATADSLVVSGTLDMQGITIALAVTGTLAGSAFNGSMKLGPLGEAPFTGKRPAPTVAAPSAAAPAAASAAGATTGVAGKWNVILMIAGAGEFPVTANLIQTGQDVSGTLTSLMGDVPLKGTFIGSTLKLEFAIVSPQGPMTVNLSGELAAQSLAGKATIIGVGEADWKAVRGQ